MANPFLVLGGIAISVVTAAFGVLAVPGWVAAAHDASAANDLAAIANAQAAAASARGSFTTIGDLRTGWSADGVDSGVRFQATAGPAVHVTATAAGDKWAAVTVSESGHVFARTSESSAVLRGITPLAPAADTPITGAAVPAGLPAGIAVTGTRAAPRISLAGLGEGVMPENITADPSAVNAAMWSLPTGATLAASGQHGDGGSIRIDGMPSQNGVRVPLNSGASVTVTPGERWRFSAVTHTSAGWNGTLQYSKLRLGDQAGALLLDIPVVPSETWAPMSAEYVVPAGVTSLNLLIAFNHTTGSIWWDNIRLEKISG